jgi:hypothetical protein
LTNSTFTLLPFFVVHFPFFPIDQKSISYSTKLYIFLLFLFLTNSTFTTFFLLYINNWF